jgi:hypothetical protein
MSAGSISRHELHVADGLAVQASDRLELRDGLAKSFSLGAGHSECVSGQSMQPIACSPKG